MFSAKLNVIRVGVVEEARISLAMTFTKLYPSEIYYSQDSISCHFDCKSVHSWQRIGETLDDICEGRYVKPVHVVSTPGGKIAQACIFEVYRFSV